MEGGLGLEPRGPLPPVGQDAELARWVIGHRAAAVSTRARLGLLLTFGQEMLTGWAPWALERGIAFAEELEPLSERILQLYEERGEVWEAAAEAAAAATAAEERRKADRIAAATLRAEAAVARRQAMLERMKATRATGGAGEVGEVVQAGGADTVVGTAAAAAKATTETTAAEATVEEATTVAETRVTEAGAARARSEAPGDVGAGGGRRMTKADRAERQEGDVVSGISVTREGTDGAYTGPQSTVRGVRRQDSGVLRGEGQGVPRLRGEEMAMQPVGGDRSRRRGS